MTRRGVPTLVLAWLVVASLALAGCRTGASSDTTGPDDGGATPGAVASLPDVGDSLEPEASEPESSSIPGFDGWQTLDPKAVDIGETITGFAMTLTKKAEWSGASRGVLFFTTMDGDFRLSGTIRASRTSDSSQDPGGDGTTQLAGLMARREGSTESWVLLEVGGGPTGLVIGTESTTDGSGHLTTSTWEDNEADLKLCRSGSTISFWQRAADSDDDWTEIGHVERKDLGGTVQVGTTLSANATPDLTALVDNLTLEPMDPGEAC